MLAHDLLALFETAPKRIPNGQAVAMLKQIYLSGKNKDNPSARFVDTSRGDDYVTFDLPLATLLKHNPVDAEGAKDSTVRIDYAKTLIRQVDTLPPISLNRNLRIMDGGHRFYAYVKAKRKTVPVIMRVSDYDAAHRKYLAQKSASFK